VILIGQYDSPFVRRVAVALRLYGIDYEHRPWSVFSDAGRVRDYNPLCRVPTLVLPDGIALPESAAILDYLDQQAGDRALVPRSGAERAVALRRTALATGVAEKAVALIYETMFHDQPSPHTVGRIETQIADTLDALETDRAAWPEPFWHGATPGHVDIALACAATFLAMAHPRLLHHAAIEALAARCEALPAFSAVRQAFKPPT
jgi:glutathione S-transferase